MSKTDARAVHPAMHAGPPTSCRGPLPPRMKRAGCVSTWGLVSMMWACVVSPAAWGLTLETDALIKQDGRTRGFAHAQVVLIEYSDFTCGFCLKFHHETWPRLEAKYVDTGKVLFVYRDYPRAAQGPGVAAAMASRCADEQGRYWPMHQRLFASEGRLGARDLQRYATEAGLERTRFERCMDEGRHYDAIFGDRDEGVRFGFRGTPGFVLIRVLPAGARGDASRRQVIVIPGAFPFEVFEEQIDHLLAEGQGQEKG